MLATIGLTIPAILTFGLLLYKQIILGMEPLDVTMLLLTLVSSTMTFSSSRANVLPGAVHLLLFFGYLLQIFQGRMEKSSLQAGHYPISRFVAFMCANAQCAAAERSLIMADGSHRRLFPIGASRFRSGCR